MEREINKLLLVKASRLQYKPILSNDIAPRNGFFSEALHTLQPNPIILEKIGCSDKFKGHEFSALDTIYVPSRVLDSFFSSLLESQTKRLEDFIAESCTLFYLCVRSSARFTCFVELSTSTSYRFATVYL